MTNNWNKVKIGFEKKFCQRVQGALWFVTSDADLVWSFISQSLTEAYEEGYKRHAKYNKVVIKIEKGWEKAIEEARQSERKRVIKEIKRLKSHSGYVVINKASFISMLELLNKK